MRYVCLLVGILLALPSFGYGSVTARVLDVRVDRQGQGMVTFDSAVTGTRPACVVSAYTNAFAFDANTPGGRAILATALAAKSSGAVISVIGLDACSTYGAYVEDWSYGVLQ